MTSIPGQVVRSLGNLKAFHEPKHGTTKAQKKRKIHSIGTMKAYTKEAIRAALWWKETYGIKLLSEATPEMAEAYLNQHRAKGSAPATLSAYTSAIRKLDTALKEIGWRPRNAAPLLPKHSGRHSDIEVDPYSEDDAETLISALGAFDPQFGNAARVARISGLRISEVVHLEANRIDPSGRWIHLFGTGTHAKGGKPRDIPILPQYARTLLALRDLGLSHDDGHLFVQRQSLAHAIERRMTYTVTKLNITSGSGFHSFRKAYVVELADYLEAHPEEFAGTFLANLTGALGHNRYEVLRNYIDAGRLKTMRKAARNQ